MMYNVFYFQVRSGWMAFHTQCALVAKTCQAKPGWLLVKLKLLKNWLSQHKTPAFQNCKKKKTGGQQKPKLRKKSSFLGEGLPTPTQFNSHLRHLKSENVLVQHNIIIYVHHDSDFTIE